MLPLSEKQYDPTKQFSRSSFQFFYWGALVRITWSKTIQFIERSVCIPLPYISHLPLCPVTSIKHAMSFTKVSGSSGHGFAYFDPSPSGIRCLAYPSFVAKLRECLSGLGYPSHMYASYSFRRGGGGLICFPVRGPYQIDQDVRRLEVRLSFAIPHCPLSIRLQSINMISKSVLSHGAH